MAIHEPEGSSLRLPIGILGGTFDPVHFGHLRSALDLLQDLSLEQVRLIPAAIPPHRDAPEASAGQRLALLQAAVDDEPGLIVDSRELDRSGPSYTVDTLASLRAELPTTPLALVMGMDAFHSLDSWHRWQALLGYAHLVVTHRPGWTLPDNGPVAAMTQARLVTEPSQLRQSLAGHILCWQVTQLAISGSHIRALLKAGRSPRYLLPDATLALIRQRHIYPQPD